MAIAGIVAAAVVVAAVGVTALVVMRDGDAPSAAAATTPAPQIPSPTLSETAAAPTSTAPSPEPTQDVQAAASGPRDVRSLAPGLFCRDLNADGYSYVAAVDYWRSNGQPNQMDEDRNGIPCQTVYDPRDVSSYWGTNAVPQQVVAAATSLPPGLFCRDLYAQGYSYSDAVSYWFYYGLSDQMDADRNGIPCETVYPSAFISDYWY